MLQLIAIIIEFNQLQSMFAINCNQLQSMLQLIAIIIAFNQLQSMFAINCNRLQSIAIPIAIELIYEDWIMAKLLSQLYAANSERVHER